MSLSDACFDFAAEMGRGQSAADHRAAVVTLRRAIEKYSREPFRYGDELRTLADACAEFLSGRSTSNADPIQRITFLADAVREWLDTPPS